jgi:DNA-directed RNA polymerase sigma subunit (sigma70/sigma32)
VHSLESTDPEAEGFPPLQVSVGEMKEVINKGTSKGGVTDGVATLSWDDDRSLEVRVGNYYPDTIPVQPAQEMERITESSETIAIQAKPNFWKKLSQFAGEHGQVRLMRMNKKDLLAFAARPDGATMVLAHPPSRKTREPDPEYLQVVDLSGKDALTIARGTAAERNYRAERLIESGGKRKDATFPLVEISSDGMRSEVAVEGGFSFQSPLPAARPLDRILADQGDLPIPGRYEAEGKRVRMKRKELAEALEWGLVAERAAIIHEGKELSSRTFLSHNTDGTVTLRVDRPMPLDSTVLESPDERVEGYINRKGQIQKDPIKLPGDPPAVAQTSVLDTREFARELEYFPSDVSIVIEKGGGLLLDGGSSLTRLPSRTESSLLHPHLAGIEEATAIRDIVQDQTDSVENLRRAEEGRWQPSRASSPPVGPNRGRRAAEHSKWKAVHEDILAEESLKVPYDEGPTPEQLLAQANGGGVSEEEQHRLRTLAVTKQLRLAILWSKRDNLGVDEEEALSLANAALWIAAAKFDPARNLPFQALAHKIFENNIVDSMQQFGGHQVRPTSHAITLAGRVSKVRARLEQELHREPTDQEIYENMDEEIRPKWAIFQDSMAALRSSTAVSAFGPAQESKGTRLSDHVDAELLAHSFPNTVSISTSEKEPSRVDPDGTRRDRLNRLVSRLPGEEADLVTSLSDRELPLSHEEWALVSGVSGATADNRSKDLDARLAEGGTKSYVQDTRFFRL